MCPAIEPAADSPHSEGAAYMAALLLAVRVGTAGAAELVCLLQFLGCGELLAGACDELCRAVRGVTP